MRHRYFKLVAEELTQQTMNFHMAHACMQSSRYLCSSGVGGGGSRVQEFPNIYHMIAPTEGIHPGYRIRC